ncbi:sensor histidine kinase [Vallicoccus soli]|uniref:histidine kinase n=1 Tax=Vallicoccus soli TaxID=2339232 RepID=A0A3A3YV81_9ACTN|nr:PAS domain-containing sensor histidine kinase [Vallicoccus soli]RJK95430.1 ATPase [Vallicoccus soli]
MPTLGDLVREHTDLGEADTEWLHLLVADWQMLADLSFADLVLWVRSRVGEWVAVAQMRPTTGPTVYYDDLVGEVLPPGWRPQLDNAVAAGRICREGDPDWHDDIPVREETIPVVRDGRVIAVVARQTNLSTTRTPSRLELTYIACADDLARMIAEGAFPVAEGQVGGRRGAPRVGDGLIRLDRDGVVSYASPNAVSAYRRLGLTADLVGAHLGAVTTALAPTEGPVDEALAVVVSGRAPRRVDVEANKNVVALRAIPVRLEGVRIGALVLCRDVTELRRRERELVTKDATIREIHHRVKNNLQTVAALLRLQARRLEEPTGRAALEEAVRRVGAIALVHEVLSRALDETVDFDGIAEQLAASMVDVAVVALPRGGVAVRRDGSFGLLPAGVATPLALVLTELVQNALEHGAPQGGTVVVHAERAPGRLRVAVLDEGPGLPEGFDLDRSRSLGLQIVRALVEAEMDGALTLAGRPGGGTEACVELPVPER